MKNSFSFIKNGGWLTMTLAVIVGVLFVVGGVQAATTISTNVSTGGTLSVTGASTLTGLTSMVQASSTLFSVNGTAYFGGTATSSFTSAGVLTLENGETISNSTNGTITLAATNMVLVGTASTSAIRVGDEPVPAINGMVFGYCTFTDVTLAASSTAGFATCTVDSSVTGALVAGDKVFVTATSSFESQYVITAASTTGISTIQLRILNTGLGAADGTLSGTSVNFWAVR